MVRRGVSISESKDREGEKNEKKRERPREERALLRHVFQALIEGLANETNDSVL